MPKQEIDLSLLVKLGSIAVHADEMLSPDGREVDKHTLRGLLAEPDVVQWLKDNAVMLPRKRVGKDYDDRGASGRAVDALVDLRKTAATMPRRRRAR
jgi:hypothetical protein